MSGDADSRKRVSSAVDAIGRCKQCGSPITSLNKVTGSTGHFCSEECRERHEAFTQRAGTYERSTRRPRLSIALYVQKAVSKIIVILILLVGIGIAGTVLNIPVLTPLVQRVRDMIGV